jgi:transposase
MRIILMLADGATYRGIANGLTTTAPTIRLWKGRYLADGVIGLGTIRPGQPPKKLTPALRAKVLSKTQQPPPDGSTHWSLRFVQFLREVVATRLKDPEIHIILDNLSVHKSALATEFLVERPNVQFHFTPPYSSWLNQVETWFSKLQRDVLGRGIFTSVDDLRRKIMRYIRLYSKTAQSFRWKCENVEPQNTKC